MQIIKPITVDLQKPNAPLIVNAKQNDKATRYIYATLIDGSSPYTIDASAVAEFRAKKPDGTGAFYDATISGNIVQCELKEQVLTVAGDVKAEINLYTATGSKLTSFAFTVKVEESVLEDATIVSSDYFNALTETTAEILRTATMVKPLGYYATVSALQAAITSPSAGDMYGVGSAEPYDFYTWDAINDEWVNNGQIKGQKGDAGVSVTVGTTTTGAAGTQASVSNSGTASDPILNFTIPQGDTGAGVPDGGTDGQIIVKSGVSAVWQDQNTVDGIAAIDGNIPLSAARQYSTMPTVTTADNGTIAQYIGTDETTYKTGHWYEVVNGAWQEIVYGDPNSVSYDAQSKTDAQKTQARSNIGAAASSHAHGSITNDGKLGSSADLPVFTLSAGVIGTKNKADAKIALDIDARGFEYGGREIPLTWAQIKAKVAAGDFTGLRIGDYKDIALNGSFYDAGSAVTKTLSNNVMRMEIAGIDSYYHYADTNVPHHIDFISRDCVPGVGTPAGLLYNTTATNSGGYIGSSLFTTLNGTNGLQKLLPADVAAVILNKRGMTEVKTGASASSWAWKDMGKLWLPTEQEVWGQTVWAEHGFGGGLAVQYPIFQNGLRHIVKGNGNGGSRCYWWCASSMADSAAHFCFVSSYGFPSLTSAADAIILVLICFRVA